MEIKVSSLSKMLPKDIAVIQRLSENRFFELHILIYIKSQLESSPQEDRLFRTVRVFVLPFFFLLAH